MAIFWGPSFSSVAQLTPGQTAFLWFLSQAVPFIQSTDVSRAGLGARYLSHGSEGLVLLRAWGGTESMGAGQLLLCL